MLCYHQPLWAADKPAETSPHCLSISSKGSQWMWTPKERRITSLTQLVYFRDTAAGFHIMFTQFRQQGNSSVRSRQSNAGQTLMSPDWKSSQLKSRQTAVITLLSFLNLFVSTGGALWASRGHSCLTWWSRFTCTVWRWGRWATRVTWAGPWHAASCPSNTCPSHTDDSSCCSAVGPNAVPNCLLHTWNMNPPE